MSIRIVLISGIRPGQTSFPALHQTCVDITPFQSFIGMSVVLLVPSYHNTRQINLHYLAKDKYVHRTWLVSQKRICVQRRYIFFIYQRLLQQPLRSQLNQSNSPKYCKLFQIVFLNLRLFNSFQWNTTQFSKSQLFNTTKSLIIKPFFWKS